MSDFSLSDTEPNQSAIPADVAAAYPFADCPPILVSWPSNLIFSYLAFSSTFENDTERMRRYGHAKKVHPPAGEGINEVRSRLYTRATSSFRSMMTTSTRLQGLPSFSSTEFPSLVPPQELPNESTNFLRDLMGLPILDTEKDEFERYARNDPYSYYGSKDL